MLAAACLSAAAQAPAVTPLAAFTTDALRPTEAPALARPIAAAAAPAPAAASAALPPAAREPSAFERLASEIQGQPVWRLGLPQRPAMARPAAPPPARVPPAYLVQPGDEIGISAWGSVEAHWLLRVDRAGRVVLPRVGPLQVAGQTAQSLTTLVRQRLDTVFRDYQLSVAVTEPGPVAVQVTGFVEQPGELVLPPLSTVATALRHAGVVSPAGSLRRVRLLREDRLLVEFDYYQLLQDGSRRDDRLLQPGDVLHVQAAGPQVAVLGSVNRPAVLELLPGETVADALRHAGGLSSVADRDALLLERIATRQVEGPRLLRLPADMAQLLADGDVLRARASALVDGPSQLRHKRVRVSGEVLRPGELLLPPGASLADAVEAAGGATPAAQLYGTVLRRDSVRRQQALNYERALRELESGLATESATAAEPAAVAEQRRSVQALLQRLRERKPEGRVVLGLHSDATSLPALPLEDGDEVHLPPRGQTVGVFGSVVNPGSFVHQPGRSLADYLQRAGGARPQADLAGSFVVRANGEVLALPAGSRWRRDDRLGLEMALPGDTVFVPDDFSTPRTVQWAKDWTQVLYQLGLGVAALLAVR